MEDGEVCISVSEPDGSTLRARVGAVGGVEEAGARVIVCTKIFEAAAAIEAAVGRSDAEARVLVLSNGALSLSGLSDARLGFGATTHGCYETSPFCVTYVGAGQLWVPDGFGDAFARAPELRTAVLSDEAMASRLWFKLAANCCLNALTAIHRCPNGAALATADRRATARAVVEEISAVAAAARAADVSPDALEDAVVDCARENAHNYSSMYQDAKRGRRTEVDALNGWVAERGARVGVPTPVNAALAAAVRALEPWE